MATKIRTLGRWFVVFGGVILCGALGVWILRLLVGILLSLVMVAGLAGLLLLVLGLVLGGKK